MSSDPKGYAYDETGGLAYAAADAVRHLVRHPPAQGYDAGYLIVILQAHPHAANTDPDAFDLEALQAMTPAECVAMLAELPTAIDPVNPYAATAEWVDSWEKIAASIKDLVEPPYVEGMTQAIVVVRSPKPAWAR